MLTKEVWVYTSEDNKTFYMALKKREQNLQIYD